jgi:putative AdoMet-dependent methyltransferase
MGRDMAEQEKKWNFDEYAWLENYDERMRNTKRLRYDETLSEVARKVQVKEGDLVLDIGTGTGNLAVKFLERGCQVVGLDPSAKMLKIAKQKVIEWGGRFQIQLCENPLLEIPFPGQTFDVVASTYTIHHITDDTKRLSIKEMKRVLKPNGRIIIGDVMFKDAADKARALAEYPDLEDEYQPMLDAFPIMFEYEGFTVEIKQMADTVWIVYAKLR